MTFFKPFAALLAMVAVCSDVHADTLRVSRFRYAGPVVLRQPVMVDSVRPDNSKYDAKAMLGDAAGVRMVERSTTFTDSILPAADATQSSISWLHFGINNSSFAKVKISVSHLRDYRLFVDGVSHDAGSEVALVPAGHDVVIKYLSQPAERDTAVVTLSGAEASWLHEGGAGKAWKLYTPEVGTLARVTSGIRPSADGLYYIQTDYQRTPDNKTKWTYIVKDVKTHSVHLSTTTQLAWTREGHVLRKWVDMGGNRQLVLVDAQTLGERVMWEHAPQGNLTLLPDMKRAIVTTSADGAAANDNMRIYVHPEDRVPGWRNRTNLSLYDFETGVTQPLTYGFRSSWLCDVSRDGSKMLFATSTECIEKMRPTSETTLCVMHLATMAVDTLVAADGYFSGAKFSPDGKRLVIKGSAEFANRIGCVLPKSKVPNAFDYQLYVMDIATKVITPVTRNFDPSIEDYEWSEYDDMVYFTALDKDCGRLYQLDPRSLQIQRVDVPQDYVAHFYLSAHSPLIGTAGQGMTDMGETFFVNAKTLKATKVEDIHERELADYVMPTLHEFCFTNSEGIRITGSYLLPPEQVMRGKDKLPLIVYYYGGCSPTSRLFSWSYAFQALASQGYVVYFVEPRGAAGFGQEFAAWHVNTAGDPQAQDIIEGTNRLCEALPIIDRSRMGCMGASYGGFMTQYLQTKTDMFACAISHAGISNHASYWGFGYWGYTYSQVSMADSYPWTDKQLYVDHSPLFNVDKIKTPLLLLHGTDDRNVPPIESSQMFTALRLLGKDAAYVTFKGEGHHIQNYDRLKNWQNTIQAWFAKYLKDDDAWWKTLYKEPQLY